MLYFISTCTSELLPCSICFNGSKRKIKKTASRDNIPRDGRLQIFRGTTLFYDRSYTLRIRTACCLISCPGNGRVIRLHLLSCYLSDSSFLILLLWENALQDFGQPLRGEFFFLLLMSHTCRHLSEKINTSLLFPVIAFFFSLSCNTLPSKRAFVNPFSGIFDSHFINIVRPNSVQCEAPFSANPFPHTPLLYVHLRRDTFQRRPPGSQVTAEYCNLSSTEPDSAFPSRHPQPLFLQLQTAHHASAHPPPLHMAAHRSAVLHLF